MHLSAKLCDLEGRSRRQNMRVVGLPESVEGPRPSEFFSSFLTEIFGQQVLPSPPEVETASGADKTPQVPNQRATYSRGTQEREAGILRPADLYCCYFFCFCSLYLPKVRLVIMSHINVLLSPSCGTSNVHFSVALHVVF